MDLNKDQKISFTEFVKAATSLPLLLKEKNMESAFSFFDINNSKFLEFPEVKQKWISQRNAQEIMKKNDLNKDQKVIESLIPVDFSRRIYLYVE